MMIGMGQTGIHYRVEQDFPDYLHDESRHVGWAESISFPASARDIRDHLAYARSKQEPVTIQGARTGVTAGAVPEGGHILSLSRMKEIVSLRRGTTASIVVQPGLSLAELRTTVREETGGKWFFPPDPTETSASVGGMIACNASGARSFYYGSFRRYVSRLRVMLIDGSVLVLQRGVNRSKDRSFEIATESGRTLRGLLPSYRLPSVKNASGYHVQDEMDLVDLLVGSEGTLGIVFEAELRLIPNPPVQFALLAFLPSEKWALATVRQVREQALAQPGRGGLVAIEFFDRAALDLVRAGPATVQLDLPECGGPALYFEYHGDGEDFLEKRVTELGQRLESGGVDLDNAWLAASEKEMERLKAFRHAIPEAVNRIIGERKNSAPEITKLGTDLAVPDQHLEEMMTTYREGLEQLGLEHVIFGHIGNNHLHVNILPKSADEYQAGRRLYREWTQAAVRLGGTISAEHGVGKLKREMLEEMYGSTAIEEMRQLKRLFDPPGLLNRGNLFKEPL
ncbi:MAG: FAD-binding oxidoreductase [Acidobacteriota bacterium]